MIRPLLRTIPTLSGNVKLACTLLDYNKINKDTVETNIRGAHIYPLSSQLFQKSVEANLLNSSWEYDVKRFFSSYSDTFFDSCFEINKQEMPLLDKSETQKPRNTDFEYGVKRISYSKSGCQYACFAPIYIDNVNDIPEYFKLDITISNFANTSTIKKTIIVNIAKNGNDDKNYIYKYLKTYLSKIDNNVIFMDNDKLSVVYYGIDLVNGGFTKFEDCTVSTLFNTKLPIQLFDYTISEGFKRNNVCLRQCLPLCFYFNIEPLLNVSEKTRYLYGDINFSGAYYNKDNIKLDWYDFSTNYDNFAQNILTLNTTNGLMESNLGNIPNIMDVVFPSMQDRWISNYLFANKLSKTFNRWKLKYSSDEDPYITNMSYAFSKNQNNNYKYKTFPSNYTNQSGFAEIGANNMYNLVFPLGSTIKLYNDLNPLSASKYQAIMNNYCLTWFETVKSSSFSDFKDSINWANTDNGFVYFNGVLYNLNYIYDRIPTNEKHIDKFAVLVYPETNEVKDKVYFDENIMFASNIVKYDNSTYNSFILKSVLTNKDSKDLFYIGNDKLSVESAEQIEKTNITFDGMLKQIEGEPDFENDVIYVRSNDLIHESVVIDSKETVTKTKNYYDINTIYRVDLIGIFSFLTNTNELTVESINTQLGEKYKISINEEYKTAINKVLRYICSPNNGDPKPNLFDNSTIGVELTEILPVYKCSMYKNIELTNGLEEILLINDNDDGIFKPENKSFSDIKNTNNKTNTIFGVQLCKNERFINEYWLNYYAERLSINIIDGIDIESYSAKIEIFNKFNLYYTELCHSCISIIRDINANSLGNYCGHIFYPVLSYDEQVIATKVAIAKQNNFDTSIEDKSYNYEMDNNILYLLPFNIKGICNKIKNIINEGKTELESLAIDDIIYEENGNLVYKNTNNVFNFALSGEYTAEQIKILSVEDEYNRNLFINDWDNSLLKNNGIYTQDDIIDEFIRLIPELSNFAEETLFGSTGFLNKEYQLADIHDVVNAMNSTIMRINEYFGIVGAAEEYELLKSLNIQFTDMYAIVNNIEVLNIFLQFNKSNTVLKYAESEDLEKNELTFYKQEKCLNANGDIKFIYTNIFDNSNNFIDEIFFDEKTRLFYTIENGEKSKLFNIVVKCSFVKLNKVLAQHLGVLDNSSEFNDMYIFRPLTDIEYDDKFGNITTLRIAETNDGLNDTSVLYPCFDSIFVENKKDAQIVKTFSLDNVTPVKHIHVTKDENGNWVHKLADTYYRYNVDNTALVIQMKETNNGNITGLYYKEQFTNDKISFDKEETTSTIFDNFNLTIHDVDGVRYGYYLLKVDIDNTRNIFNIRGILDNNSKFGDIASDYIPRLKYISYINGVDISKNRTYVAEVFKQLCPFLRINLLSILAENNTIMIPKVFNLEDIYAVKTNNTIGALEKRLIFRENNKNAMSMTQLQRYTNAIIPYFEKTTNTKIYNYKYKDVQKILLETGKFASIGDIVYDSAISKINKPIDLNIYTSNNKLDVKDYKVVSKTFTPFEYKYFDASKMLNTEKQIKISIPNKLKYNELVERQTDGVTLNVFSKYLSKYGLKDSDGDLILFLYKKYSVQYDTVPVGVFADGKTKAYKMTYIFNLL